MAHSNAREGSEKQFRAGPGSGHIRDWTAEQWFYYKSNGEAGTDPLCYLFKRSETILVARQEQTSQGGKPFGNRKTCEEATAIRE